MKRSALRLVAAAISSAVLVCGFIASPGSLRAGALPAGGGDWPQYRHDETSSWVNPGLFDAAAAQTLTPLWTYDLGVAGYGAPTIVGDTVYLTTAFHSGKVLALDAATGAVRWQRQFLGTLTTQKCGIFNPGIWHAPAVVNGVLYVGGPDGKIWALDAATGATLWNAQVALPSPHGEFLASAPVVSLAQNKLYIGTSAITDCELPPGKIASVDLSTHAVIIQTVLAAGRVGGSIWSSITVDEAKSVVYATTGNPQHAPSLDPLSQAFVAFDAQTLRPLDHWQDPTYTSFEDSDFGASPTLFTAADGTPLVGAPNKDGWLFVLRRGALSAGPLWKRSIAVNGGPDNGRGSIVAPTFANGVLYAAGGKTPTNETGSVLALDPGTGALLWKHVPPGYVIAGMPQVGDLLFVGVTAVGNATHTLEVLDAKTGKVVASFAGPNALWAAPTVGNGLVVYTDTLGHVTALQVPAYRAGGSGSPDAGVDAGSADAGADAGSGDGGTGAGSGDGGTDAGTGGGSAVLFNDSFSHTGPLGAGWTVAQGNFTDDGAHAQPTAARAYAAATAAAPLASTVQATVGILGVDYDGVFLRGKASAASSEHYAAWINHDGSLWIGRRNNYSYSYLGSATAKVDATTPHRLSLSATGTTVVQLTLSVDGLPVLSVSDSTPQRLAAPGLSGIFSYSGSGAAFDDFEVDAP